MMLPPPEVWARPDRDVSQPRGEMETGAAPGEPHSVAK
jgi:hypothetical protein